MRVLACTTCGVPYHVAPDLFEKGEWTCVLKRQPSSDDDMRAMVEVFAMQDTGRIRYAGTNPTILDALRAVGEADPCDASKPPHGR